MTKNIMRSKRYKREYDLMWSRIIELISSDEPWKGDPIYERAIELGRDKHLPLGKAIEIAEKEFANK